MEKKEIKTTTINGEEYNLDSSPEKLLQKLDTKKKFNPDTKKWEEFEVNYLDVDYVKHLIDKLVGIESIEVGDMEPTGRNWTRAGTKKAWDDSQKKYSEQAYEQNTIEHKLTIKLITKGGQQFSVTKRGAFTDTQLSTNDSLRGAQGQLEAIVLKALSKYIGNIFRVKELIKIDGLDIEADTFSTETIVEEKVINKTKQEPDNKQQKQSATAGLEEDFFAILTTAFANGSDDKKKLKGIAQSFAIKNGIINGSAEKATLSKIFTSFLSTKNIN